MNPISFNIVDSQTGAIVGSAKTRAGATRSVDKRDNAYGGYRYRAVPVYDAIEEALFKAVRAAILPEWA